MGKNLLVGVGSKARHVKALYVGVGGKARKVKKVYVGVGGKARLVYTSYVAVSSIDISINDGFMHTGSLYITLKYSPSNAPDRPFILADSSNYLKVTADMTSCRNGVETYTIRMSVSDSDSIGHGTRCVATVYRYVSAGSYEKYGYLTIQIDSNGNLRAPVNFVTV